MDIVTRLLRADDSRKSRLHTASGHFAASPEILRSLGSTLLRVGFSRYPTLPWITYPAIRYLDGRLRGRRLFEYGSGTSTGWYADRCREIYSVENNPAWFSMIQKRLAGKPHVTLKLIASDEEFTNSISAAGGKFDVIVIDSQPAESAYSTIQDFRIGCLRRSLDYATADCIFIVDNTDAMPKLNEEVEKLFFGRQVQRFPGWVPGILHPNETTIIVP